MAVRGGAHPGGVSSVADTLHRAPLFFRSNPGKRGSSNFRAVPSGGGAGRAANRSLRREAAPVLHAHYAVIRAPHRLGVVHRVFYSGDSTRGRARGRALRQRELLPPAPEALNPLKHHFRNARTLPAGRGLALEAESAQNRFSNRRTLGGPGWLGGRNFGRLKTEVDVPGVIHV